MIVVVRGLVSKLESDPSVRNQKIKVVPSKEFVKSRNPKHIKNAKADFKIHHLGNRT